MRLTPLPWGLCRFILITHIRNRIHGKPDFFQCCFLCANRVRLRCVGNEVQKRLCDGSLSYLHVAVFPGSFQRQSKMRPHIFPDGNDHIQRQVQPLGAGDAQNSFTVCAVLIQPFEHRLSNVRRGGNGAVLGKVVDKTGFGEEPQASLVENPGVGLLSQQFPIGQIS